MKYILNIIAVLSLGVGSFAQSKTDNLISITDANITIPTIQAELFKKGFSFERIDTNYLATNNTQSGKYTFSRKIVVFKQGDKIQMMAFVSNGSMINNERANYSFKGTIFRKSFEELISIAKAVSKSEIIFETSK